MLLYYFFYDFGPLFDGRMLVHLMVFSLAILQSQAPANPVRLKSNFLKHST